MNFRMFDLSDLVAILILSLVGSILISLIFTSFAYSDLDHSNWIKKEKHHRCWSNGLAKLRGQKMPYTILWSCKLGDI